VSLDAGEPASVAVEKAAFRAAFFVGRAGRFPAADVAACCPRVFTAVAKRVVDMEKASGAVPRSADR